VNTIRIGPIDYEIVYVAGLRDGDLKLDGWFKFPESRILIEEGLSEQARRQILWHEIFHGIFNQFGGLSEDKKEETVIDALAYAVMNVLRDNPELSKL
jgi:hypothetical protein